MKNTNGRLAGGLILWATLSLGCPLAAHGAEARPTADDKCVAQCDEEADKCSQQSGQDSSKNKRCDTAYDECLRKCG
jgi:hypothetical protein